MSATLRFHASNEQAEINVTPLIDVLLALVVILMIAAPLTMKKLGVPLAGGPETVPPPRVATLSVLSTGELFLDGNAVNRAQLTLSDKFPFVFARGTPQVEDGFEMIRLARGLSPDEFLANAHCYTVINTNSPRQLDIPMAQGIIDFAKAGQISIRIGFASTSGICGRTDTAPAAIIGLRSFAMPHQAWR